MHTISRRRLLGVLLLLAVCSLLARADDDEDEQNLKKAIAAARVAVLRFADGQGEDPTKPLDVPKEAAALAKHHKIEATMKLFKPKSRGGIGIGELVNAGHKDSIELLIRDYTIKPPKKGEVALYADDLIKVGRISLAIAEMTPHYIPLTPSSAEGRRRIVTRWKKSSGEMKKASADLIEAANAKDEKAVAIAAKNLHNSCAECHSLFTGREEK